MCNINGCRENHRRFLHGKRNARVFAQREESPSVKQLEKQIPPDKLNNSHQEVHHTMEGDAMREATTMKTISDQETKRVALCTIPILLKNGSRKVLVNCLLDEGSNTTYINEDIVQELGLTSEKKNSSQSGK